MKFRNIDSETVPRSASFLVKIVHRVSTLLTRSVTAEVASTTRFNIPEWRVASLLYAFGTSRQKELVDRSFADQAQTSRGLADLERTGIVRSLPSGEDRRVKNFELTEEGRREVEAAMPAIFSYFSQIDQSLNDEEKATLIALLDRVLEAAQNSEQPPQG
ncbi:MAG: MarR family transcriptional regulator [Phycisphaera sp. TMED24]|nr:MAG: MarR family transcriptional regulator [Phycisphaera sp. TMED24]